MSAAGRARVPSIVTVLVVSSDDGDHSSLTHILEHDHCYLHRASNRQTAVSVVHQFRPSVVICDEVLADGDWRDLLADLQSGEPAPPLIVSSRLADDRLWAEVLNLGGYDLLTKPFTAVEVSRVVRMAARRGRLNGG